MIIPEPRNTDKLFKDSPDTGDPRCICSRCMELIPEDEIAIRIWPQDVTGKMKNTEYRYHLKCLTTYSTNLP